MEDRRRKGVVHIDSEDSGFHTPHESDSDFVSKATAHESGSDCVSEAQCSSEDKTDGERDSITSPNDKRPKHRREELWSSGAWIAGGSVQAVATHLHVALVPPFMATCR